MTTEKQAYTASAIKRAIKDRGDAIQTAAFELAARFRADPQHFDPESISNLGRTGLREFLTLVGTDPDWVVPTHSRVRTTQSIQSRAESWTDHPNKIGKPAAHAIGGGFLAGALVIAAFAAVLRFS